MTYIRISLFMCFALILCSCAPSEEPTPVTTVSRPTAIETVVGIGRVEPATKVVALAATEGGVVMDVYKRDGDVVRAGDALLRIDDTTERLALSLAKQRFATQRVQIRLDEESAMESEVRLANKRRMLEASNRLVGTGAETTQNVDDLETEVKTLMLSVQRSTSAVAISKQRLQELQAEISQAEHAVALRTMRAPSGGMILEMLATKGIALTQYETYAQFGPNSDIVVRCEIDELFADRMRIGLRVNVRPIANEQSFTTGAVLSVSPYLRKKSLFSEKAGDQEDRRVREVVVRVQDASRLLINAKVECIITL
ncbi:hypothetical protein BH10BAC6_BH10BAC6_17780 [soil metagenome]